MRQSYIRKSLKKISTQVRKQECIACRFLDGKKGQMNTVRCHAISRKSTLENIANAANNVIGPVYDLDRALSAGISSYKHDALGIKTQASIFYGFCNTHDAEIFKKN